MISFVTQNDHFPDACEGYFLQTLRRDDFLCDLERHRDKCGTSLASNA